MRVRPTTRFGGLRPTRSGAPSEDTTTIITIDDDDDVDVDHLSPDEDHPSWHRTCWKHAEASLHSRPKKPTKHQLDAIDKLKLTSPCFSRTFPHRPRSRSNSKSKFPLSRLNTQLTDKAFEFHVENLWRSFSEDRGDSFVCISSLWFVMYLTPHLRIKVLSWIKGKQLFSKKYIFVPIVRWGHWSLLILCHLGQSSDSEYREQPCMLLLDSLQSTGPRRLEPDIRKFVLDIFIAEGRPANKQLVSKIPLLVPKVPQQTNEVECGIYVLFFIDLFVQHAPENFTLDGYPYFMQENWFSQEDVEDFRAKLISLENPDQGKSCTAPSEESSKILVLD